jgi:FKBP-type peptidyl-prolyl cis-trans isomerase
MKNIFALILLLSTVAATAQTEPAVSDPVMETDIDSMSYFLGLMLGYDIKGLSFKADIDLILKGMSGVIEGTTSHDQQSTKDYFRELQKTLQQNEREEKIMAIRENLEKGNQFLLENGQRDGVITTESGLQYEVLVNGEGPMPADTSVVTVHYEGKLIDGIVFDSSYEREEPGTFPLTRVIKGWTEGVQLMPVGSTYMFYIPADLGYGSLDSGPIPGNSVLIFKIELLGVK